MIDGASVQTKKLEEWAADKGIGFVPSPTTALPEARAYYDSAKKEYLVRNARGAWIPVTESAFKRRLRLWGYSTKPPEGNLLSAADCVMLDIQDCCDVACAGPLAGYTGGFYEEGGFRFLVTESPKLIEPVPKDYPTIRQFLVNLLGDPTHDQLSFLYGWLKVAFETLRNGGRRPGQMLVIAGPHNCGKSLLQKLITEILGGRYARPHQFMMGDTSFNSDLFGAEHLMLEDEQASTDLRSRRNFGTRIKDITVNDWQRCHAKGRPAVSLRPLWRITLTVNDEPENLMILPPIDDSLTDKLIILRATRHPMPESTHTMEERDKFWAKLVSELPGFLHDLLLWEIPKALRSERFGITHFHHPAVLEEVDALSPERRLLTLIDGELFVDGAEEKWEGSAIELEKRLKRSSSGREAEKLFSFYNSCARYLGQLTKKRPDRVVHHRTGERRLWIITPPAEEK